MLDFLPSITTIFHGYGPAETTFLSSYHRIIREMNYEIYGGLIPVGAPKYNYKYFLLDRYKQQVPIGLSGEIIIAGMLCA